MKKKVKMNNKEKEFWKFVKEIKKEISKWPKEKQNVVYFLFDKLK